MDWHRRLTQAREAMGLRKSAFAKLIGVSPPTVTDWENGETKMIEGANLVRVCSALNITPEWLLHGSNSTTTMLPGARFVNVAEDGSPHFVQIPKVALQLRAGVTGFRTEPDERDGGTTDISKEWIKRKGYDPAQLIAIEVKGESMEPTLYEGDTVVINLADKKPMDNAVFAFNYEGEPVVKRLSRDAGQWWLLSDNHDQRRFYRRMCKGSECIIIGRVVRREGDRF
ncbi:XRE family transcriptional regulator [Massilia endophytica]|uniref:XRE family transcriptional regulator n=1 Tax=Massilia endophytica TaxID=2899220 RepID=UPI001E428CFC|nr:LexA family transcriptional regulator [Massilia endophytica]UGQ45094.1 LexA family transcriptional regulator [Massilia endophytica]